MINNLKNFGTVDPELKIILGPCIESLSISGDWTNAQYTGSPVDYTGLTFTVTYNDGTTASVTPTSISPSVWGSTEGEQTCTFTYEENKFRVNASKSVEVLNPLSIPLTLQARESGNISITKSGDPSTIYYSKNGGAQTELASNVNIPVSAGDKVSFYRTLSGNLSYYNYFKINCTNYCYIYGNVMSLYNKDSFINLTTIQYEYTFFRLFYKNSYIDINESVGKLVLPATTLANNCYSNMFSGCTSLTTAPTLPATTLKTYCYGGMFRDCSSLTTAPVLPATTLANNCYSNMFEGCTSLTTAPVLPATTLANDCYSNMFEGCTSLTTAPTLPATTLIPMCYSDMFSGCTSLTTAPTLPATTLKTYCYGGMFRDCSSLTTAPILPATTLVGSCYVGMFYGCTSLTSITCLATNISAEGCTDSWVYDVAATGTFKTPSSTAWTTGESGIPSGWTRVNA